MLGRRFILFVCTLCAGVLAVSAHGDTHELIVQIDEQLLTDPNNPELYFNRAVLYQSHNEFNAAFLDYQKVKELQPDNVQADLNLANLCLDHQLEAMALSYADAFLQNDPGNNKGLFTRARIYRSMGQYDKAQQDLLTAIDLNTATPEYYFELVEIMLTADPENAEGAIAVYRLAQNKLGDLTAFREGIIQMEMNRGNWENALVETELLIDKSARKERWYLMKGDLLKQSGRTLEAEQAYRAAKAAIEVLSPAKRNTDYIKGLITEIELALTSTH